HHDCCAHMFSFSVHANQIGSRLRRNRTAAARNAAATTSPIHRPGVLRNLPGVSCDSESTVPRGLNAKPFAAKSMTRYLSIKAKCELLNATFSRTEIAKKGNTAQRNVARRAHAETISSQP